MDEMFNMCDIMDSGQTGRRYMLYSMTGFGKGEAEKGNRKYIVEIKSVNHRYCEIFVKTPRDLGFLDEQIRGYIRDRIGRGKLDVTVRQDYTALDSLTESASEVRINKAAVKGYMDAFNELCKEYGLTNDLTASHIAGFPEVAVIVKKEENADEVFSVLITALESAVGKLTAFRQNEGSKLNKDMKSKLNDMRAILEGVVRLAPSVPVAYMELLSDRIREYFKVDKIDEQRIAQEVAIYADKCCIDEEIVRLRSHLDHFGEELEKGGRIGRKLDFLTQEINREINTIGSKANDLNIVKSVVELKSIIEQIREQVQNIE
jgi:uncharacterized protein (TIGR00255 family)